MNKPYKISWVSDIPKWWLNFVDHALIRWRKSSVTVMLTDVINEELPPGFKYDWTSAVGSRALVAPSEAEMMMFILKWS